MKSCIFIVVLAALSVCNDAASIPNEVDLSREQASLLAEQGVVYREDIEMYEKGEVRTGDILFYQYTCNVPGIPNTVQFEDVRYRGNSSTRITTLRMTRLPPVPGYTWVGALGTSHLTVRVVSTRRRDFFKFPVLGTLHRWDLMIHSE